MVEVVTAGNKFNPNFRSIEATDPVGQTERLEFWWENTTLSATAPSGEVPTGFSASNTYMNRYGTTTFRHEPLFGTRRVEATDPAGGTERLEYHWSHSELATTSSEVPTGFSAAASSPPPTPTTTPSSPTTNRSTASRSAPIRTTPPRPSPTTSSVWPAQKDRRGRITRHFYDGFGRRTATLDPAGGRSRRCGVIAEVWKRWSTPTATAPSGSGMSKGLSGTAYTNEVISTPDVSYTYMETKQNRGA